MQHRPYQQLCLRISQRLEYTALLHTFVYRSVAIHHSLTSLGANPIRSDDHISLNPSTLFLVLIVDLEPWNLDGIGAKNIVCILCANVNLNYTSMSADICSKAFGSVQKAPLQVGTVYNPKRSSI
jgi:hypothetical protein